MTTAEQVKEFRVLFRCSSVHETIRRNKTRSGVIKMSKTLARQWNSHESIDAVEIYDEKDKLIYEE